MNNPSMTVAVPNWNGAAYLGRALDSLCANRPHVHWWLQDAGSTDNSLAIAGNYRGPHDVIVSKSDRGQADALNQAFAEMGGDVVGFLNSDDEMAPGAAGAVADLFVRHPEVDLVYGRVEWMDAEGHVTGNHQGRIDSLGEVLDIYHVWWGRRQWVQPEVFMRRTLWEKVGPFDIRYHYAFDYDYWVRCFEAGARVARIDRVLARFRIHPQQKSVNAKAAADEIRDIVDRALARLAGRLPSSFRRRLERRLSYDRYHAGQDWAGVPFAKALWSRPDWLLLREVRERIGRSL